MTRLIVALVPVAVSATFIVIAALLRDREKGDRWVPQNRQTRIQFLACLAASLTAFIAACVIAIPLAQQATLR